MGQALNSMDVPEKNRIVREFVYRILRDELHYLDSGCSFTQWDNGPNGERTNIRSWEHPLPTAYLYAYARLIFESKKHDYDQQTRQRIEEIKKQFQVEGIKPADVISTFDAAWSIAQRAGMAGFENMAFGNSEVPAYAFLPGLYKRNEDIPQDIYETFVNRMRNYNADDVNLFIAFQFSLSIWTAELREKAGKPREIIAAMFRYKAEHVAQTVDDVEDAFFSTRSEPEMHPYLYRKLVMTFREGLENDFFSPIILVGEDEQIEKLANEAAVLFRRNVIRLDTDRPDQIPAEIVQSLFYIRGDRRGKKINHERITTTRRGTIVIYGLSALKDLSAEYVRANLSRILQEFYLDLSEYPDRADCDREIAYLRKLADSATLIFVRPEKEKRLYEIHKSMARFCLQKGIRFDSRLPLLYLYSLEELYDVDFYKNSNGFLSRHYPKGDGNGPSLIMIDRKAYEKDEEFRHWMTIDDAVAVYSCDETMAPRIRENHHLDNILLNPDPVEIEDRSDIPVILDYSHIPLVVDGSDSSVIPDASTVASESVDLLLQVLLDDDERRLVYIVNDTNDDSLDAGQMRACIERGVMEIGQEEKIFEKITGILMANKIREFFAQKLTMDVGKPVLSKDGNKLLFRDIRIVRAYKKDCALDEDDTDPVIGQENAKQNLEFIFYRPGFMDEKPFTVVIGPPDVGKTVLIRSCARAFRMAVYRLQALDLLNPGFEEKIKKQVDDISKEAPAVLLLDNLDSLFAEHSRTQSEATRYALSLLESLVAEKQKQDCDIRIVAELDPENEKNIPDFFVRKAQFVECERPTADDFKAVFMTAIPVVPLLAQHQVSVNADLLSMQCEKTGLTIRDVKERLTPEVIGTIVHRTEEGQDATMPLLEVLGIRQDAMRDFVKGAVLKKQLYPYPAAEAEFSRIDVCIPEGSEVLGKWNEWLDVVKKTWSQNGSAPVYGGIIHGAPHVGKNHLVRCLAAELKKENGEGAEVFCIDLKRYLGIREKDGERKVEFRDDRVLADLAMVLSWIVQCERAAILLLEHIHIKGFPELPSVLWDMTEMIDRVRKDDGNSSSLLVLCTMDDAPRESDLSYYELSKRFGDDYTLVSKLGGFAEMLPPDEKGYGMYLAALLHDTPIMEEARIDENGFDMNLFESLGEIFIRHPLTKAAYYGSLVHFLVLCIEKYGEENLTTKMLLDEFYFQVKGKEREKEDDDTKCVSFHEAGHTFLQHYMGNKAALATIVSRGDYGGFMMPSVKSSGKLDTEEDFRDSICVDLAGRAAEQVLYYNDRDVKSSGAGGSESSDLGHASWKAFLMVTELGMGTKLLMPVEYELRSVITQGENSASISRETSTGCDLWYKECMDEADRILHEEMEYTRAILRANKKTVTKIANLLEKEGTITAREIEGCFTGAKIVRVSRDQMSE